MGFNDHEPKFFLKFGGNSMKYGVLYHKYTKNLGDDIQAYASSLFLPQIDYMVDREELDTFKSKDNEAVSVIMSAWMFRKKWNWPPAPSIYPLFVGTHLITHTVHDKASSLSTEPFEGIGGDYLRSYGPIGCRDIHTQNTLDRLSIDNYFSGCITLTLPKFEIKKEKKDYICLVDVSDEVERKIRDKLKNENIEIKTFKHINRDEKRQYYYFKWEERAKIVEERLKIYQNAKCVVTKRLHGTLPCLAMEVPVLWVLDIPDGVRFSPYKDWVRVVSSDDIINDNHDFDFLNPTPNSDKYKETREALIKIVKDFIKENENINTSSEFIKTTYTEKQREKWQYNLMKNGLDKWLRPSMDMVIEITKLKRKNLRLMEKNARLREKNAKLREKNKILKLKSKSKEISTFQRIKNFIKKLLNKLFGNKKAGK